MKLLYIIPLEYPSKRTSGITTYTMVLAKEMRHRKHEVVVLARGDSDTHRNIKGVSFYTLAYFKRRIPGEGLLNTLFPYTLDRIKWMIGVYHFVKTHGPFQIIETSESGSSCLFVSCIIKSKTVVRLHKSWLQYRADNDLPVTLDHLLVHFFEMCSLLVCSGITAPTRFMLSTHRLLLALRTLTKIPHAIIPNGITIPRITPGRASSDYLLTVGGLEKGKGIEFLIRSCIPIFRRYPKLKFIIAGGDTEMIIDGKMVSYRTYLNSYILQNKLQKNIRILPQKTQTELDMLYRKAMIYVASTSPFENQPMAILDAIRWGKAVVVGHAGGIPEFIISGKNGMLYEPGNVRQCANAIFRLIYKADERMKMEKNNRIWRNMFRISSVAKQTENFYNDVILHTSEAILKSK